MSSLLVSGNSTGVGKTLVASILCEALGASYWKPVQAGNLDHSDSMVVRSFVPDAIIYPEACRLKSPLSPHHAARIEGVCVPEITPPQTEEFLVIEGSGGIMTPLCETLHMGTLFCAWNFPWILVSKHYLGSINHTLLAFEYLKMHRQKILGIVFNGSPNPDSERFILNHTGLPLIGRVGPELYIDRRRIQWYAAQWKPSLAATLVSCGILSPSISYAKTPSLSCVVKEPI